MDNDFIELKKTHEKYKSNFNNDKHGYIYLIREREFYLGKELVFKLGATIQKTPSLQIKKLDDYKKESQLMCACICDYNDVFNIKRELKKLFNKSFQNHSDGTDYFIGNPNDMVSIICETLMSKKLRYI
jgi:hypothetical protein